MIKSVLIYITQGDFYLLLFRNKKKNDYNEGKYIGVGGKINQNETKEQALIREVKEETGLTLNSYKYNGLVHFIDKNYEEDMFVYTSNDFKGDIINCNEGTLYWVHKNDLLSLPMWEGDKYFLTKIINNQFNYEITLYYKNKKLTNVTEFSAI